MADVDGTGARQVTQDGFDAENPTMSADGAWIAYSTANPAALGIWKIRPDGTEATHLLKGSYQLHELAPKTGWIAAISGQAASPTHPVKIIRLEDGSAIGEIVIPGRGANVGRSRWMSDGRTLVSWGDNDEHERCSSASPSSPAATTSERVQVAIGGRQRKIDTFGALAGGRAHRRGGGMGRYRRHVMADGIRGSGASLPAAGAAVKRLRQLRRRRIVRTGPMTRCSTFFLPFAAMLPNPYRPLRAAGGRPGSTPRQSSTTRAT